MFSESVLCGENKSKTSGRVTPPPTKPAWLLCLLSGDWQVNSLSLEHSSLPRGPGRLNVPKTALFSPLHRAALTWSPQPWRQLSEPSASPGQRQETPDCRDPWRHRPSLEAEDSRQVTATETRISVSPRQVGAESESLSQVISLSLGSQAQLLWGPTLCPDDFFEPLAPSSEADEASEVESHGKRRIRDKSLGHGLAITCAASIVCALGLSLQCLLPSCQLSTTSRGTATLLSNLLLPAVCFASRRLILWPYFFLIRRVFSTPGSSSESSGGVY